MIVASIIAGVLVLATVMIHYEALRFLAWLVPRLKKLHRLRVVVVVLGCFCAHMVEIIVFAAGLYFSATGTELGLLEGATVGGFSDYLYFSIVSYTSLGLGDIYPSGELRLLAGIEALIGLMMITWSATFTFLEMRSLWEDRQGKGR